MRDPFFVMPALVLAMCSLSCYPSHSFALHFTPRLHFRSLAGKPGAARKAWEALQAEKLARGEADAVPLSIDHMPSILEDDLDVIESKIRPKDMADEDEDSSSDERIREDQLGAEDEGEEEEPRVASAVRKHPLTVEEVENLQVEAKAKGYGKLYAAMGGGEEGLEACIAVEALCEVRRGGSGIFHCSGGSV